MEPDAEIKFARVYTAQSLNLDRAGAFAKIKFHAARAVSSKTRPPKPARLIIYAAQTTSRIGAILDKIGQR
ncbi:hypothetical protein [uncultured Campylobacter sp.]|uniref:hypothetical protein n=1 Tax=uncultured Campylobacter sp. TaxID=218934 RepID=UPI00262471AB|nr:hypothetical protein [uncultured Campylobacter sp.]